MWELQKHFFRHDRAQPICLDIYLWGRHEVCEFLVKRGNVFACEAGGVGAGWALKHAEDGSGQHLATFNGLLTHRNYRINTCPYRLRMWLIAPLVFASRIIKWTVDVVRFFRNSK